MFENNEKIVVVSTRCGSWVDIDLDIVIRDLGPVDSITSSR